ncbi:hypothetical protein [Sphingomonas sp.]|uniref:hypothetical protein n=1 Tax=Sphingomonas sp. TaxID=28214 RepID=UPI0025E489AF|nr:hypothetical protein [Sphingomonas sp.]
MTFLAVAVVSIAITASVADPPARLTRIADANDRGELNPDATMGQVVVGYYIELQTKHPNSVSVMNDDFTCRNSVPQILKATTVKKARGLSGDVKAALVANNQSALESLSVDVIAELDGVDAVKIRTDEALGPGVYRPAITAIAYTIGRCRFY